MIQLRTLWLLIPTSFALAGCPAPEADVGSDTKEADDDGGDEESSEGTPEVDPSMSGTPSDPSSPSEMDTDPMTETESDTCQFICEDDTPPPGECDIWQQDCPMGEKCMPWANDGGNSWNSTVCAPVAPEPGQPGDGCTVEGSGVSGQDTCDEAAMCWDVDPETGTGTCLSLCQGSQNNPVCDDPTTSCIVANDGVLPLCLPDCDPLLQDCSDGQACYVGDNAFVCVPDASGPDLGAFGDPCEYTNACDPGLLCVGAAAVPGCTSARCCSEYCDLAEAMPADACSGQADGQECIGVFEEGDAPPGTQDFGFCAIPV